MKRFRKIYLEISNLCNLSCAFCPGTKRPPRRLTVPEMEVLLPKLRDWTDFLYFHLMGEPLCHPELETFLTLAGHYGFKVILTTNGTLLPTMQDVLLRADALHKVNVSLHAFEANDLAVPFSQYLSGCFDFGCAAEGRKLVVYRLWNQGGADQRNQEIVAALERRFPKPWVVEPRGTRLGDHIYLEYGDKFDWPDLGAPENGGRISCYGLKDQLGILCDGTVVPCCLDHEGDISLGNLFVQELGEILAAPKAQALLDGFACGKPSEDLCRRCGFAKARFGG